MVSNSAFTCLSCLPTASYKLHVFHPRSSTLSPGITLHHIIQLYTVCNGLNWWVALLPLHLCYSPLLLFFLVSVPVSVRGMNRPAWNLYTCDAETVREQWQNERHWYRRTHRYDRQTDTETHCDRQTDREIDRIEQYGDSDCDSDICRLGRIIYFLASLFVYLSIYMSLPYIYQCFCLFVFLCISLSVCLSVFTYISVSVYLYLFACCISLSMPSYSISMCT
jgi:hypothetical protein